MPVRIFRSLRESGDTIVEVLMALAVLGSALAIGYAAARSGLAGTEQAQEHSIALKYAQQQAERLEELSNSDSIYSQGADFCLPSSSGPVLVSSGSCTQSNGLYNEKVSFVGTGATDPSGKFVITESWPSLINGGTDQVQLNYKVHKDVGNGVAFASGTTIADSVLEEGSMTSSGCGGCANGSYPDGNGSTDGNAFGFFWQGTATGTVSTTAATQHIYVYAREDPPYLQDVNMVVQVGSLPSQSFTVSNISPYQPYSYTLSSALPQGSYIVNISFTNDGCDPTTCNPDRNLHVDRVVFSPT